MKLARSKKEKTRSLPAASMCSGHRGRVQTDVKNSEVLSERWKSCRKHILRRRNTRII